MKDRYSAGEKIEIPSILERNQENSIFLDNYHETVVHASRN